MRPATWRIGVVMVLLLPLSEASRAPARAGALITFEGLKEGEPVIDQYQSSGVLFDGPGVLTAGSSLNDLEFPPSSGMNVVAPGLGGVIRAEAVGGLWSSVSARITGLDAVTLTAFAAESTVLGSASTPGGNFTSSGSGLLPNLLLRVEVAGISYVQFTSSATFTLDDFQVAAVPEPASLGMLGLGQAGLAWWIRAAGGQGNVDAPRLGRAVGRREG